MDRYKVAGILGDGSFGTVFDGTHLTTGAHVAIKRLKQAFDSWAACTRLREVASLTKLRHEHIIRLLEVVYGKDDGTLCFIFEYVESNVYNLLLSASHWKGAGGGSPPLPICPPDSGDGALYSQETGSGLSEACIRRVMGQLLSGLSFMHRHGFFHRDLKPENLLCRSDGTGLKIADFGQARNTRSRPPYTPYVGTRWYRSPEGALGLPTYNSPVDIWGAGAIFAELYAGHPVFPGTTGAAQIFSIASVLGPFSQSQWPEGSRQCAACGIRMDSVASSAGASGSGGGGSPRDRLEALCIGASPGALDAICSMLQWEPARRPSAADVLASPFFASTEWETAASGDVGDVAREGSPAPPPHQPDDVADESCSSAAPTPIIASGAPTRLPAQIGLAGGDPSSRSPSRSPAAHHQPRRPAPSPAEAAAIGLVLFAGDSSSDSAAPSAAAAAHPAATSASHGLSLLPVASHAALSADIDADLEALGLPSATPPPPRDGGANRRRSSVTVVAGGMPKQAAPGSLAEAFAVRQALVALRRGSTSAATGDSSAGLDASLEDLISEVESGGRIDRVASDANGTAAARRPV